MTKETLSTEELQKKERQLAEYLEDLDREERKMSENLEIYEQIQQQEQRLLEEVAFLSQGTVAEASALRSYDEHQLIERQRRQTFSDIEEAFQQQKRSLRETLSDTEYQRMNIENQEETTSDED
ncbi:DUF3958 family protein [Enterococcus sp. BWR-S5]|uniref:DUF3958 family protein n=1 Tax=Enterococcus sp. BWR-S5 TaxID=2787714 RepID=UPI00192512D5|nr:DUF3958 family protein [Enterococcus sp. BWR-S5]MBL1225840.1 DUF3958 family protein [Enterococcus sp. BWR-S5]